ncbi:C2 domain-containing protein 3 isoform X2 [Toxotes jaculatrix]|uniref:C2 domain-containing protein 3 isoform X1 n=1 Tax=Toxotes jaculatrix TaxID=941984 RepID=UPI001B3AE1DB|nr:C2 domain-containing protein 3 isoform X1 [Toxotes jaculatrix]XP_040901591.1 C2 domain-containing protein 3 isoform X2 [Toxotes jaculatrix]
MKSRKQRAVKAGSSKRKVSSDVSPSTSLPPLVEGQLRCFLRVTVSRVLWTVHKPPSTTFVRLRWWGESSNGTHFFPRDGSQLSQKTIKTTARFAIRCGPKQFTSYLTDMGSLVLEVLTKADHLPIARAQVAGISRLSLSHPIGGFYTLVSPTSEKLGELQVSLNLEPLTEAYDSSSSGPTTDISAEGPQVTTLPVPSQPRSLSAGSGKESVGSSSGNTPRGKDHLYFQNTQKNSKEQPQENQAPLANRPQNSQTAVNASSQETCGQTTNDVLSVILERGNKLRNAMVLSALTCDMDSATALKDAPLPLPKDNILPPSKPVTFPSGTFLENILHSDSTHKHSDDVAVVSDCSLDCAADMDNRAVDLLLGSLNTSPQPLLDGESFSAESLSGHSSVCGDSELNDPQYDQSLLENLFYKTPMSDSRPDDTETTGQGTMSSGKNQPKQLTQSGPKISGGSNSEAQRAPDAGSIIPGLSAGQLTLLSSIQVARVTIESLTVPTSSTTATPRKTSNKGKPPRPLPSKKCTYFVEYVFPMASTSSRRDRGKAGDGEVTRVASSKVTGGAVKFLQPSVFPVRFSTAAVKQWLQTDLVFKIYSRKSDQKKPVLIGKAIHPLRCLLQSKQLSESVVLPVQSLEGKSETQGIGPLVVSLELETDSKDFSSGHSKGKLAWRDTSPSQTAHSPQRETSPRPQHVQTGKEELPVHSLEDSRLNVWSPQKPRKEPSPHPGLHTSPCKSRQQVEEDPEVLLHTLLMVPDGKNFICGPMQAPNVYLNCKLFWCDEMARSAVSWGQANPSFNFAQVTPVALTTKLLERMKNNVMVIELWQKMGSSGQDRLLGLVKLPLHQFYMSFRDPKITHLLLQAQYPVLGVDCYMPVIDVFSGSCKGNLRVVLAMGGSEQIVALQRTRDEEYNYLSHLVKPVHLLDHQPHLQTKGMAAQEEAMREHLFVIRVEKVSGLTPLQSTVWGEADCYIQYSFPCQDVDPAATVDQNLIESTVNLKPFRTTTTLCVPDPAFGHTETHVLLAPEGVPVQRLLLSSLASQGLSSGGGIQFEVWCRYYYPNVRDQLVAKGLLPLSKLCAMVTMQRQHRNEAQMFSLPLIPRTDSPTGHQPQPSGLLDVCIQYKHRAVRPNGQTGRGAASRVVTLVVQVHRASGLQAAARLISEQDERFSYFAGVGVNTYVTVQLSFLPESERRCTRIAARTFCPEFDHHTEVSCDLLVSRSSGETCSLAEQLEEASAVFTVWNKDNRRAVNVSKPKDVMLGTVKIPMSDLIHKRTGISGWFGVYMPQETSSSQHQHVLVGGLEISVNFAHHSDRERVIKAAQALGWVMAQSDYEKQDDDEAWEESMKKLSLTFSMPRAWIPVHCLLLPGHSELQRSTYCYFRYKFYDQEAFCSHMKHPSVEEGGRDGQATVSFEGSRTVELRRTQPLIWYLQEERLEVQVWVAFKKEKTRRPTDTDRLVGSAFVDLSSLTKTHKQKLTLSGVYPLFRRSAADLQGAALRVHITLTAGSVPREVSVGADTQVDSDSLEELLSEEVETADRPPSPTTPKKCTQNRHKNKSSRTTPDISCVQHTEMSMDESFPVTVTVDRAMHLNLKGCPLAERSEGTPCCCVSYVTADSAEPVSTTVIANTDSPVWDHQHECRLSKQLLVDPEQSLVFKVWHKGEMERVLGFASVDLSPLLCGFQSVCGWYNITDFSGQCHGQLKVSITPLKGVHDLRGQRKTVNEEAAKNSSALFQALPLSYRTTATYSSFPSHISRYPEQKISSPDHTDKLFSQRSNDSDRHFEHMDKVRLYHQGLQEQTAAHSVCSSGAGDINPSSSLLFSALRKKLSELDNIQRYFTRKLSTPTFSSVTEHDCHPEHQEQRESETDTSQLLLKSNQLVGEVNNIISGLRGRHHLEVIPSNPQSSSTTSPVGDDNPQTIPESISSLRRALNSSQEDISPLPSPLSKMSQDHTDSEGDEEKNRQSYKVIVSEDENGERTDEDEDGTDGRWNEEANDEEGEDEEYDEVVVKPRHLNEVTSLTDKTSPWTSILSEPDMVSLESLEAPEEPGLGQDEDEKRQMINLETHDSSDKHQCPRLEESDSCNGSAGDASDTEGDDERTLPTLDERQAKIPHSPNEGSGGIGPSATIQHTSDTPDASLDNQDSQVQPSVPNFFLPSHQLEESMRAIQLAPSFSQLSSDHGQISPVQCFPHRRGPPRRPNMSPSSLKKETERIAKIFAARFDENH